MLSHRFTFKGKVLLTGVVAAALLLLSIVVVFAQGPQPRAPQVTPLGPGFTYQGELKSAGAPVNGPCQMAFRLFDDPSAGNQIGLAIIQTVPVTNGLFTVVVDAADLFGSNAFNGDARWLEIEVSTPCPAGGLTTLAPRQPITPAPYALTALKTAYKNVLVVARSGGHYHTIGAALASIGDNSATNHYLIWVAPGTYTETVAMKPYVDIEGAGELATKITSVGSISPTTGTIVGASNAELRWLSVENTGGSTNYAIAISNNNASPRLTHVTATASGGTNNEGVYNTSSSAPTMTNVTAGASGGTNSYGVHNYSSSPVMMNITASASGGTNNYGVYNESISAPAMTNMTASASGGTNNYGVYDASSSPTMTNVTASASGGTNSYGEYNFYSSLTIDRGSISAGGGTTNNYGIFNFSTAPNYTVKVNNSRVSGSTASIMNSYGFVTLVGASQLGGGAANANSGLLTCIFSYNDSYVALTSACQ